jgi:SAM-dependent methyltransferase
MLFRDVERQYDGLAQYGAYATQAPENKGGGKARYIAAAFDAALLPELAHLSHRRRLLDIGSGTGILLEKAAPLFDYAVGVDLSHGMLQLAQRICTEAKCNVGLIRANGLKLPLSAASFSHAVARESLCYVPDNFLPIALAEIYRVLEPGGCLLLLEQVSVRSNWIHSRKAPAVTKRSRAALTTAITAAGFRIEAAHVVRSPRFPFVYLAWMGLLSDGLSRSLASVEVSIHRKLSLFHGRRWNNVMFLARKEIGR